MTLFTIVWFIFLIINIYKAHHWIETWKTYEQTFGQIDEIFKNYETLFLRNFSDKKDLLRDKRRNIEYLLMRQDFIAPSFFPIVNEVFLRDDFYFAGYLNFSLSKTISKIYKINLYSLSSLFIVYVLGKILERPSIDKLVLYLFRPKS